MTNLILLLDGAADEPIPSLDFKTPLEYACKDFIDRLTASGIHGYTYPRKYTHQYVAELILGKEIQISRGIVEAFAEDLCLEVGDVSFRLTPARLENGGIKWIYSLKPEES